MAKPKKKKPTPNWQPQNADFDLCFQRVGRYMFTFACIESALNRLITTAMRLGSTEGVIVCANLQVRDKLYIAETAISQQGDEDWRKAGKAVIKKARKHSEDRNIVAHNFFGPEEDGIRFFIRKAKGKLEFPDVVWSTALLEEKMHSMAVTSDAIERIAKEIIPKVGIEAIASLLTYSQIAETVPPTPRRGLLGAAYRASRQAPKSLRDSAANPPSGRQTLADPLAGLSMEDWPMKLPEKE